MFHHSARRGRGRLTVAVLAVLFAAVCTIALQGAGATEQAPLRFFDTNGMLTQTAHIDPIKFPGGVSHLHNIFCANGLNSTSDATSLLAANNPPTFVSPAFTDQPHPPAQPTTGTTCNPVGIRYVPVLTATPVTITGGNLSGTYFYNVAAYGGSPIDTDGPSAEVTVNVQLPYNAVHLTWTYLGTANYYTVFKGLLTKKEQRITAASQVTPNWFDDTGYPTDSRNDPGKVCFTFDANGACPAEREQDGAAYWVPALWDCGPRGVGYPDPGVNPLPSQCHQMVPFKFHTYYFDNEALPAGGNACTPLPGNSCAVSFYGPSGNVMNFGEISGLYRTDQTYGTPCAHDTLPDPSVCTHAWRCVEARAGDHPVDPSTEIDGYGTGNDPLENPCKDSQGNAGTIRISIDFPRCWDGVHGHLAGETHLAFQGANQQCPPNNGIGFYLIPGLSFEVNFHASDLLRPDLPHYFRLSCGALDTDALCSTDSAHGDFLNGWVPAKLHNAQHTGLIDVCENLAAGASSDGTPGCNVSP